MDPVQYYVTTLSHAAQKLGPIILFVALGYLVFIKLPFMMALKVNKENKPKSDEADKLNPQVDLKTPPDTKIKIDSTSHQERQKKKDYEREQERIRQEKKKQERDKARAEDEKKQKKSEEKSKQDPPKDSPTHSPAAVIFEFKPGETFTKTELKKRYHELLRQNHPDKVAALGSDFKTLAEKKTKDINSAYEELKKKAS